MSLIEFCLAVYFFFHLWNRSDLLQSPRVWSQRQAPKWIGYMIQCPFCVTFHLSWVLWLVAGLPSYVVLVAPVINLVLDLIVKALIRTNEPPVLLSARLESTSYYAVCGTSLNMGDLVKVENGYAYPATPAAGDGVKIHPSDPWWKTLGGTHPPITYPERETPLWKPDTPFNPLIHEQTK